MDTTKLNQSTPDQRDIFPFAGCIDNTLAVFERHNYPFILVGVAATNWSGSNSMPGREIDLLIDSWMIGPVIEDLIAEEWDVCQNPYIETHPKWAIGPSSYQNDTPIRDTWLVCRKRFVLHTSNPENLYLRLWPESLYHLSIDCNKIQAPDVYPCSHVLLEEEYYYDPEERFGPNRASKLIEEGQPILRGESFRFRKDSFVPIYIPRIEDHLNALLDQWREECTTNIQNGNSPKWHIHNFIRYNIWDWPPASAWLLDNKIQARNYKYMKQKLDRYVRKPLCVYDSILKEIRSVYPWDLPLYPELRTSK